MPQINLGTVANDGTGSPLRTGGQIINQYGLLGDKTVNAAYYKTASITNEAAITLAITAAALLGAGAAVWVPASMLPYNASLVTFNTAVRMLREGGNPFNYDVRAYGFGGGGAGDTAAIAAAGAAANADVTSHASYMPSSGFPFGTNIWGTTFNGVVDNTFGITYNELVGDPNGPGAKVAAGEPDWRWAWEAHYYDGVAHWMELNWDIVSADGLASRRVFGFQYNRTTYGTSWFFLVGRDGAGVDGDFDIASGTSTSNREFVFQPAAQNSGTPGGKHVWFRMFGGSNDAFAMGYDGTSAAPTLMDFGPDCFGQTFIHLRLYRGAQTVIGTGLAQQVTTVTYSASMGFNMVGANDYLIVPTNGTAFAMVAPIGLSQITTGRVMKMTIRIKNTFGVLGVATFTGGAGGFRLGAAWVQPANGFSRSIGFDFDAAASAWIETWRSAVDVAN